jgi:hypothetical protein
MTKVLFIIGLCCILLALYGLFLKLTKQIRQKDLNFNISYFRHFLESKNFEKDICEHGNISHKYYPISFDVSSHEVGYYHIKDGWIWLKNDTVDKAKSSINAAITYCKIHYK